MSEMKNHYTNDDGRIREFDEDRYAYEQWLEGIEQQNRDHEYYLHEREKEHHMRAPKNTEGGSFEKHPRGWANLVCTRLIDQGTHFNPKKQENQRRFMIGFESEKLIETEGEYKGKPFMVFANFNYSMYKNSMMCQFIEQWLGRKFASQEEADDFPIETLMSKPGYGNITHSDDGKYVNISAIGPLPPNLTPLTPQGDTIIIDQDNLNLGEVAKLNDKMKERIMNALEQTSAKKPQSQATSPTTPQPSADNFNDDIPF